MSVLPIATLILSLTGCGNPDLASVAGKVTLDSKPVEGAFIKFIPNGPDGAPSFGKTDSEGNYRMMFTDTQAGAMIGENKVFITTADVGLAPGFGTAETIPTKYNTNTELVENVKSGSNKIDFTLTSDGAKVVQPTDPDADKKKK